MTSLILALVSASLIISLFSLYKLRETRSTLAITSASLLSLKERLKGESLDFEGFSASDLLTLQEVIDNASALTSITEETATLLEEQGENLEHLLSFNLDDVNALHKVIECGNLEQFIDSYVSDYVCEFVTEDELNDAIDETISNLVIKRKGEP